MKPGLYLDTNHGTKSVVLKENRVIKRKIEKLEGEITAKKEMIISAKKFVNKRLESIRKKKAVMGNKLRQTKNELKLINEKILKEINLDIKGNLLTKQQEIYLKESELRNYYEPVLNKWQSDIEKKRIYIDKKRDELKEINYKVKKLNPKKPLYEMDTRKDHIMINLEVALNNADLFLKKNFFPAEYKNSDFKTIRDILYKQDGFIKLTFRKLNTWFFRINF